MTDDSPFHIARKIRNYGDLLARETETDAQLLNLPQGTAKTFS